MGEERIISNSKPDKNGTVIQVIEKTCPKCLGRGGDPKWSETGYNCYTCHGLGVIRTNKKVYNKEYRAKLDQRNKRRRESSKKAFFGINQEKVFLVDEEYSLENKNRFQAAGGVYVRGLGWYFLKKPINFRTKTIKVKDYLTFENGQVRALRKDEKISKHQNSKQAAPSTMLEKDSLLNPYVGKTGETLKLSLIFADLAIWKGKSYYSQQTTRFIYRFYDDNHRIFIWNTRKPIEIEVFSYKRTESIKRLIGDHRYLEIDNRVELRDQLKLAVVVEVKGHHVYKDEPQTVLKNVRIKEWFLGEGPTQIKLF